VRRMKNVVSTLGGGQLAQGGEFSRRNRKERGEKKKRGGGFERELQFLLEEKLGDSTSINVLPSTCAYAEEAAGTFGEVVTKGAQRRATSGGRWVWQTEKLWETKGGQKS